MELLNRYQKQIEEFMKIDDMNFSQRCKRLPAEKHFWVARLIDCKINRDLLIKEKKLLKDATIKKLLGKSPVGLTLDKKTLDGIDSSIELEDINDRLRENEVLTEYLEHIVKIFSFLDNTFKNIIEVHKLETL